MDTRIYEITHKEFSKPNLPEYIMQQVGAALHDDLGYVADNTGDNISEKNPHYCELTGIYWLWKNVSCDIIGVCHYRRYFFPNGDFLRKEDIEDTLKDYDVILPQSFYMHGPTVHENYRIRHHIKDLDTVREVISDICPEYLNSFDLCMNCDQLTPLNMIVTRKEIFDKYCSWLFSILFETEKRIDISDYDDYQTRVFGFLSERLTDVFFIYNSYKIKEYPIKITDPKDVENLSQIVDLKKHQISIILSNMNKSYMSGAFHDLIDSRPMDIDFHGKTPVWFCWWQGIDSAPDIVKACLISALNNIPSDKAELNFISMENVGQYINLPEWVVRKFSDGKISLSHLSYILRFGILYRYGGLWLDADNYIAEPFSDSFWNSTEFYSPKTDETHNRNDMVAGRWSLNLIKGSAGNTLFRYVLNALYEYWSTVDELIDESVPDYIMNEAYEKIPDVREQIDNCSASQPHMRALAPLIDDVFKQKKWNEITSDTNVFKLSYNKNYKLNNSVDKETFYSIIINKLNQQ